MNRVTMKNALRVFTAVALFSAVAVCADDDLATDYYTGKVSALQFKSDGSFLIQLTMEQQKTSAKTTKCQNQTTFLVKQNYKGVNPRDVKRMKQDVRAAFFSEKAPFVSLAVVDCSKETGVGLVHNVMLGRWQELEQLD